MQLRLPASLDDGITSPQQLIEKPSTLAPMSQKRLRFVLLLIIDPNGLKEPLRPFKLIGPMKYPQIRL